GRLAVRKPALQTIPRASDYHGALIRSSFTAPPGYKLIEVDYSQAELRVLACLSGEEFLQRVYREGRDLHSEVAEAMFGPNFTKEQRVQTKMFNFSYTYGGTEYSFAKDAGLSLPIAKRFVRDYNRNMPRLAAYRKEQVEFLYEHSYIETRFGRRRHFPLIVKNNKDDARKASVHQPVAGGAADLTLISGTKLVNDHGVEVCLMVHDSILAYALEDEAEETATLIAGVMQATAMEYFPEVPWPMEPGRDIEIKDRWADPISQVKESA
ncbi:MAG: DNA polymerase, partial [Candidatus Hermodarchaeia archaeon]